MSVCLPLSDGDELLNSTLFTGVLPELFLERYDDSAIEINDFYELNFSFSFSFLIFDKKAPNLGNPGLFFSLNKDSWSSLLLEGI